MTVTANVEDALSTVGVTVPDADAAANFFASLLGANRVVRYPGRVSVPIGLSGSWISYQRIGPINPHRGWSTSVPTISASLSAISNSL